MSIVAFPLATAQPAPQINPHQPPGWQRIQAASVLAIHAAEDQLAGIGISRAEARVFARAVIRTFLQNMAMSSKPTAPVCTVFDTVEDFIRVCEQVADINRGQAS